MFGRNQAFENKRGLQSTRLRTCSPDNRNARGVASALSPNEKHDDTTPSIAVGGPSRAAAAAAPPLLPLLPRQLLGLIGLLVAHSLIPSPPLAAAHAARFLEGRRAPAALATAHTTITTIATIAAVATIGAAAAATTAAALAPRLLALRRWRRRWRWRQPPLASHRARPGVGRRRGKVL